MKTDTREALERYKNHGIPVGDFLQGILIRDMIKAASHADKENGRDMYEIIVYCIGTMPRQCWGSQQAYDDWCSIGGLHGMNILREAASK